MVQLIFLKQEGENGIGLHNTHNRCGEESDNKKAGVISKLGPIGTCTTLLDAVKCDGEEGKVDDETDEHVDEDGQCVQLQQSQRMGTERGMGHERQVCECGALFVLFGFPQRGPS